MSYAVFCLKKKIVDLVLHELEFRERDSCAYAVYNIEPRYLGCWYLFPLGRRTRLIFFFLGFGDHRDLHSFPTRRSSDLQLAERHHPGIAADLLRDGERWAAVRRA